MTVKWPEELVVDLARRRAVVYLGAGVSASAQSENGVRPPVWTEFLDKGRRLLGRKVPSETIGALIKQQDLLSACELLKSSLDESWATLLKESFVTPRFKPGDLHRAVHELDATFVLTPNFDDIYDRFAKQETHGDTQVKTYYDRDVALFVRRPSRLVLKVHGSADEPSRMVFTRGEYATARNENRAFFRLVESLFLTNTVLFIGTSLNDPDLRLLLESIAQDHSTAPPHYMLSSGTEISKHLDTSLRSNMNLKILRYSPADGHQELVDSLVELGRQVDLKRLQLGAAQTW